MKNELDSWKITTRKMHGLQEIVTPETNNSIKDLYAFRLDLKAGISHTINKELLELSCVLIEGESVIKVSGKEYAMVKYDSFYLPGNLTVTITSKEDSTFYIGGAIYENIGEFYFNKYNPSLPLGDIRQVHGKEPYQRDVYMTLPPKVEASRLITGLTWSEVGKWSSWPPHQHEADLEEAYWYFDMPAPAFGLHISYEKSGEPTNAVIVRSDDMVLAPWGYHPTASAPSNRNTYFWILAAHSHSSRRYDLAISDPAYDK